MQFYEKTRFAYARFNLYFGNVEFFGVVTLIYLVIKAIFKGKRV